MSKKISEDLIKQLHSNVCVIIGKGSTYEIKSGKKGGVGFSFYYKMNGKKDRKTFTGYSYLELLEKAQAFLDSLETVNNVPAPIMGSLSTFEEVSKEWFVEYKNSTNNRGEKISFTSVDSRMYSLKRINKFIGNMIITDIDEDISIELMNKLCVKDNGKGFYSRSHVDKAHQTFLLVMKYASKCGLAVTVPKKLPLPSYLPQTDENTRFLDEEQLQKIFDVVKNNRRYYLVTQVLLATGMRQEELFALTIDDLIVNKEGLVEIIINKTDVEVSKSKYEIRYTTKSIASTRTAVIPYELYEELMTYYKDCIAVETEDVMMTRSMNGLDRNIFVNINGDVINLRTFQRCFKDYVKRNCNIDIDFNATLHMFRHSFVSLHVDADGIVAVAKVIGDSIATTEKIYNNITKKQKVSVCDTSQAILERFKK